MYQSFDQLINMNMLLSTKRTGNFIIDTIVISGLMFLVTALSKYLSDLIYIIKKNGISFRYTSIELRGQNT